jgi:ABC-2 type transport system permease protein
VNLTIARITARALFGRRRFLLLLPLPILLVGLAILADSFGANVGDWGEPVIVGLGLAVVVPVIALVVGTGVLGSEIDDGTLAHILAKPISRSQIILSKLVVGIGITFVTTGVPLFLTGLVGGSTELAVSLLVAALVGSIAYTALFAALSLLTRRPVLLGLIYILIWEDTLGNVLPKTAVLSIQQYEKAVADRLTDVVTFLHTDVSFPVATGMAFVFAVGATLLAIDRLRSFSVVGETS